MNVTGVNVSGVNVSEFSGAGLRKEHSDMDLYTKTVQGLIAEFERLPGIGRKTAERLAYHVLRAPADEAMSLAYAIRDVKKKVRNCSVCFNLTEADVCEICSDPRRDQTTLCVVEQPKDLYSIETSDSYRGLYHVLLGAYAPLDARYLQGGWCLRPLGRL